MAKIHAAPAAPQHRRAPPKRPPLGSKRVVAKRPMKFPKFVANRLRGWPAEHSGPRKRPQTGRGRYLNSAHEFKGKIRHRPLSVICTGKCISRFCRICRVMNDATILPPILPTSDLPRPVVAPRNPNAEFDRLVERSAFLSAEFTFSGDEVGLRPAKAFARGLEAFSGSENPFARRGDRWADRGNSSAGSEHTVSGRNSNSALRKALRSSGKPRGSPSPPNSVHASPASPITLRLLRVAFRAPSSRKGVVP